MWIMLYVAPAALWRMIVSIGRFSMNVYRDTCHYWHFMPDTIARILHRGRLYPRRSGTLQILHVWCQLKAMVDPCHRDLHCQWGCPGTKQRSPHPGNWRSSRRPPSVPQSESSTDYWYVFPRVRCLAYLYGSARPSSVKHTCCVITSFTPIEFLGRLSARH